VEKAFEEIRTETPKHLQLDAWTISGPPRRPAIRYVRFTSKPEITGDLAEVRFPPNCDVHGGDPQGPFNVDTSRPQCANTGRSPAA
jgi:hypothetical protein